MSTLLPHTDWRHQAACRRRGMSEIFYPPPDIEKKHDKLAREKAAKNICATCPVCLECLDHALRYEEMQGVWGGKTEAERKLMLLTRTTAVGADN